MVAFSDETTASTSEAANDILSSIQARMLQTDGELDAAIECAGELEIAVQCVAVDATTCGGCIDTTNFAERFSVDTENEFRKQLAFTPAAEPGFCFEADARMCAYHDTIINCCCEKETMAFLQCAWNRVYLTKFGVLERCESSCAGGGEIAGGDPITVVMCAIVGFVGLLCCLYICYRRRQRMAANKKLKDGDDTTIINLSIRRKNPINSDKTLPTVGDIEEGSDPFNQLNQQLQAPNFSNSMRIDPTGALIPNGIDPSMAGMSMQSMRSMPVMQQQAMAEMSMRSMRSMPVMQQQQAMGMMGNNFMMAPNGTLMSMSNHSRPELMNLAMAGPASVISSSGESSSDESTNKKSSKKKKKKKTIKTKKAKKKKKSSSSSQSSNCDSSFTGDDASFAEEICSSKPSSGKSLLSERSTENKMKIRDDYEQELLRAERQAKLIRFENQLAKRQMAKTLADSEEKEEELKKAEKEAKKLKANAKLTIAQKEAEKKGVTHALEELEDEHEDMVMRIAELEEENAKHKDKAKKKKKRSKSAEWKLMMSEMGVDDDSDGDDFKRRGLQRSRSAQGLAMPKGSSHSISKGNRRSRSKERKLLADMNLLMSQMSDSERDEDKPRLSRSNSLSDFGSSKKKRSKSADRKLSNFLDASSSHTSRRGKRSASKSLDGLSRCKSLDDFSRGRSRKARSRSAERKMFDDDFTKSHRSRSKERRLLVSDDDDDTVGKKKKRSKSAERNLMVSKLAKGRDDGEPISEKRKLKRAISERGQRSSDFDSGGGLSRTSSHIKRSSGGRVGSKLAKPKELQDNGGDDSGGRGRSRSKALSRSERSSSKDRFAKPPKRSKSKENLFRN